MKKMSHPIGRALNVDELLNWLKAPAPSDRRFAALKLGRHSDPCVVEPLIKALDDPEAGVRSAIAHSLGELGRKPKVAPLAKQTIERLTTLLNDENEQVVASAIYALGQLGDSNIGSQLLPFLDHSNKPHLKIRNVTIEALRDLQYQPAIPYFQRLLRDPEPGVRSDTLVALFSMRHVSNDVERILKSLLNGPDSILCEKAKVMLKIIFNESQFE